MTNDSGSDDKTMEWWIRKLVRLTPVQWDVLAYPPKHETIQKYPEWGYVHVIEKSYADQLEARLKEVEAERDAYKAALEVCVRDLQTITNCRDTKFANLATVCRDETNEVLSKYRKGE